MAESQASPGNGADPGTGTGQAAGLPDTGTGAAAASDQVTNAPSASQPSEAELDEITRTVSAGGEKAVDIVKHWQRVANEKNGQLEGYRPLEDLVTALGGAENVRTYLLQYDSVMQNPEAREAIVKFLETKQWAPMRGNPDDLEYDDDPTQKELQGLRGELHEVRTSNAVRDMRGHVDSFFAQEMADGVSLGDVLSKEQKAKIVSGLEGQIKAFGRSEAGQQTLRNLNKQSVGQMMQLQLSMDEWARVGERAHLLKIERKKGAATGAAPVGGTTGNEDRTFSGDLAQALEDWAKDQGVDLHKFQVGR